MKHGHLTEQRKNFGEAYCRLGNGTLAAKGPGELILNKKIWEGLSKTAQSIINTTCDQIYFATAVRTNAIQPKAMRQLNQGGAEFVTLRDSELDKLRKAWHEVAEEESAKDPLFAEVYQSYKSFREQYAIWGDRAFLK